MLNRIEGLKRKLNPRDKYEKQNKLNPKEIRFRNRALKKEVKDKFGILGAFGRTMVTCFDGKLDLGNKLEHINWEAMPQTIRSCFEPEFSFQPEDITGFDIRCTDNIASNGERNIKMTLYRNNWWYSQIDVGLIVRKDYVSPTVYASCQGQEGQLKAAREAMEYIKERPESEHQNERDILYYEKQMKIFNYVLSFAVSEAERQLDERLVGEELQRFCDQNNL